ncbi:MAG: ATP-binding cassette domain-containing protein [Desulfuromonadales bacterium]|nr:ATP-binding cassette domain-containing protein [Desulfuromonadales bacterium]NIS40721.1 ATP-binding cassette domain-containing protein [Desulfuromonadales bacterium]
MPTLLSVRNLAKSFSVKSGTLGKKHQTLKAVDGVSLDLSAGETLGVVGESGCGKSTAGKLIMGLLPCDSGEIVLEGTDIAHLPARQMRPLRRKVQMIFQDPYSSLNPRLRVGDIVGEPLKIHNLGGNGEIRDQVVELLERVGLDSGHYHRYPHEFSGGQRQRIGIARALALKPKLIIADEPVSALDLSIQAQIINLLQDLQAEFNLTYLVIAHDLSVIEHMSDRVAVMYLGRIVEMASAQQLYEQPRHPYGEALLNAVPVADPQRRSKHVALKGEPPSPIDRPDGCHFHPRCPYARPVCREHAPRLEDKGGDHLAACHFSDEVGRYRTF